MRGINILYNTLCCLSKPSCFTLAIVAANECTRRVQTQKSTSLAGACQLYTLLKVTVSLESHFAQRYSVGLNKDPHMVSNRHINCSLVDQDIKLFCDVFHQ